jgi:hypothetical protein
VAETIARILLKLSDYIFNGASAFIIRGIIGDDNLVFDIDRAKVAIDSGKQPAQRCAPIISGNDDSEIHSVRLSLKQIPLDFVVPKRPSCLR